MVSDETYTLIKDKLQKHRLDKLQSVFLCKDVIIMIINALTTDS